MVITTTQLPERILSKQELVIKNKCLPVNPSLKFFIAPPVQGLTGRQ
jgi:hypothetical protein